MYAGVDDRALQPGQRGLSFGYTRNQASSNWVEDPGTSSARAIRQSEDEQRAKLCELSKQNSELLKKLRLQESSGLNSSKR